MVLASLSRDRDRLFALDISIGSGKSPSANSVVTARGCLMTLSRPRLANRPLFIASLGKIETSLLIKPSRYRDTNANMSHYLKFVRSENNGNTYFRVSYNRDK